MSAVRKFTRTSIAIAVTLATGWCYGANAYENGPLPGHTGVQGEADCTECHFGHDANTRGGSIKLHGVPANYVPGYDYSISVMLEHEALSSGGFQLTIHDANSAPGGQLTPQRDDVEAIHVSDTNRRYIQHKKPRKKHDDETGVRWTFVWTAPEASSDLIIGVSAVAANDDASALGDYVYTKTAHIEPQKAASKGEEKQRQ